VACVLSPAHHRDAEQKRDEQAGERCFAGNGADGRERFSGLPRRLDRQAQAFDRSLQRRGDLRDGARAVSRGIGGAFRHAGLRFGLRCFHVRQYLLFEIASECDEAATFGYPRARVLNSGSETFGYPRQAPY
jgi:hypothetical protein